MSKSSEYCMPYIAKTDEYFMGLRVRIVEYLMVNKVEFENISQLKE